MSNNTRNANSSKADVRSNLDLALEYAKRGWKVFPLFWAQNGKCSCRNPKCDRIGKHPITRKGFQEASSDEKQVRDWWTRHPTANIGLATGHDGLVVMDVDVGPVYDKKSGELVRSKEGPKTLTELVAKHKDQHGPLPDTLKVKTGSGGVHYWFKSDMAIPSSRDEVGKEIDVRGQGGYVILPPSTHESGGRYEWIDGPDGRIAECPSWLAKLMMKRKAPANAPAASRADAILGQDQCDAKLLEQVKRESFTEQQYRTMLSFIPADIDRDPWWKIGAALKLELGEDKGFQVWDEWSRRAPDRYDSKNIHVQWASFVTDKGIHGGTVFYYAKEHGFPGFEAERVKAAMDQCRKLVDAVSDSSTTADVRAILELVKTLPKLDQESFLDEVSKRSKRKFKIGAMREEMVAAPATAKDEDDYGLQAANIVLKKHFASGALLIRPVDKAFWRYNGRYWEMVQNDEEIRKLCIDATRELFIGHSSVDSVSRQALNLLEAIQAKSGDPIRLTRPPAPVINCMNGELWITADKDNFSVELRPHSPESYLRYGLDIEYDPSATCPIFDDALLKIFQESPDPKDMRRHLYEVFGYALQPKRDIKQFWLWEGGGDNGKSGVIQTLCKLTGEAAVLTCDIRKVEQDYYRAALKSKLILLDDDVDWRTVLPDGILKQLSEGKQVAGRDPYFKVAQFTSCVLPMMLCNKYPLTKDLSNGVLTRAHVIPFRHRFVRENADGTPGDMVIGLFERIWASELPGILNRAIEGLQRLRNRGGYQEPEDCIKAKQEFLTKANPLPRFLASSACITTMDGLRANAIPLDLRYQIENSRTSDPAILAETQRQIDIAMAKAEAQGLKQTLMDFYRNFTRWCQNEGITGERPRRGDVENYLGNLGYVIVTDHNQKWVTGVVSYDEGEHRPTPAM